MAKAGIGAREAVILEPTGLVPVIAHKGPLWFDVEVEGRSAHAADPAKGLNAIDAMMEFIQRLKKMHEKDTARTHDPFFGTPTLNIGKVEGGQAPNIVPDRCRIKAPLGALHRDRCSRRWEVPPRPTRAESRR